ncbi:MAG: polyamine aminopropyltransferase [Pseudomonadota bacterium]
MSDHEWQAETLHEDAFLSQYRCSKVLHREKTEHQDLVLFENPMFGTMLMLDGVVQLTTSDEFIYHEMMAHVPILAHGAAGRVMIVGGGDGGVAREVLRHDSVESLTQVEIDAGVIEFSKQYLPQVSNGAFDDPRFELVIADGAKYVAERSGRFDVIIVDSTDPIGPGAVLFTKKFYAACKGALRPGGVLVTQNGVPFVQGDELKQSCSYFRDLFADAWAYRATIPTYVGGEMTLGWASDNAALCNVSLETLQARFEAAGLTDGTRYYAPDVHKAAFALPPYIRRQVEG